MEDWPAFGRSFDALVELVARLGSGADRPAPATIDILSGDIHFSYHAQVHYPPSAELRSQVHQLVSSPIRNALTPAERFGMRVAMTGFTHLVGRGVRRLTGLARTNLRWRVDHGPVWDNCLGQLTMSGRAASVTVEQAAPDDDGEPTLAVVFDVDLRGTGAASTSFAADPRGYDAGREDPCHRGPNRRQQTRVPCRATRTRPARHHQPLSPVAGGSTSTSGHSGGATSGGSSPPTSCCAPSAWPSVS